jgi:hypothetical protein
LVRPGTHYALFRLKMLFCRIVVHKKHFSPTRYSTYIINTLTFIPKISKNVLSLFFIVLVRPGTHYALFRLKMLFCRIMVHKKHFSPTRYSTYIINTLTFIPKNSKNVLSIFFSFGSSRNPLCLISIKNVILQDYGSKKNIFRPQDILLIS